MKKTLGIVLSAAMVFSLTACSSGSKTASTTASASASAESTEDTSKIEALIEGIGRGETIYSQLSESDRQAMVEEAKKQGMTVTFGDDGTMTVVDADGNTTTQNGNGSWEFKGKDGTGVQLGGQWPDNDYTKQLPAASFSIIATFIYDNTCTIAFGDDTTIDQIRAYAEEVKKAGFTVDAKETDTGTGDKAEYTYEAANAAGYTVVVSFSDGTGGVAIKK